MATKTVAKEQEFIRKIEKYLKLKQNQIPDPKFCPTVYLVWSTCKDGLKIKNAHTGRFIKNTNETKRIMRLFNWKRCWYEKINDNKNAEYKCSPNVHYFCRYIKPDYNLGIIEFSNITIDTKRTNGYTDFKFLGSRTFMSMDDRKLWAFKYGISTPQIIKITDYVENVPQSYYTDWWYSGLKLTTMITNGKSAANHKAEQVISQFFDHQGIKSYFNGKCNIQIKDVQRFSYTFVNWLKSKPFNQKAVDKEVLRQELVNVEFPDVALQRSDLKTNYINTRCVYFGIVKYDKYKEYDVFRFFNPIAKTRTQYSNYEYEQDIRGRLVDKLPIKHDQSVTWEESYRIFCSKDKTHIIEKTHSYYTSGYPKKVFSYVTAPNSLGQVNLKCYWLPEYKEIKTLEIFKYISDNIKEYCINFAEYLITIRKPIVEQLTKIDCRKIVSEIIVRNEIAANLKECVGKKNAKGKTLKDVFGMTTKQIKYVEKKLYDRSCDTSYYSYRSGSNQDLVLEDLGFIYELLSGERYMERKNDVSYLDMKTFEDIIDLTITLKRSNCLHRSWNSHWNTTLRYASTFNELCPDNIEAKNRYKYITKMLNICKKAGLSIRTINDNASMYNRLRGEFKPTDMSLDYQCASDISRAHETLVQLTAAQDAENRRMWALKEDERNKELEKKMVKIDEKRKELEYEDDTYLIRLPRKLSELGTEGSVQRICIGGYVNRHAEGSSNIYFLRKKSNPDVPFFAIEERNKRIIQIHGYGNKWLGSDDDSFAAVPFVMKWLHKNELLCETYILTCKSTGYSGIRDYRTLPKVEYDD